MDKVKQFIEDKIVNNKKLQDDIKRDAAALQEYRTDYLEWVKTLERGDLLVLLFTLIFLCDKSDLAISKEVACAVMAKRDVNE